MEMKVEIELPELEGFEYTGEYRPVMSGEYFLNSNNKPEFASSSYVSNYHILKPVEKWIVPTLEYMQENYKWGEAVEARFRHCESYAWQANKRLLFVNGDTYIDTMLHIWTFCEIKEKVK
jgi:hypothetical protein